MKQLPKSQLEVMLAIWNAKVPITRNEIQKNLSKDKWKITTLNTLLNRLTQNGFLQIGHKGREYVYTPLITKEEYMQYEGVNILKTLYENSLKKFVASVCSNDRLTKQEITDLQELLAEFERTDTDA